MHTGPRLPSCAMSGSGWRGGGKRWWWWRGGSIWRFSKDSDSEPLGDWQEPLATAIVFVFRFAVASA